MATSIQDIKHILYRAKIRLLHQSAVGKAVMLLFRWKTAGEKDGITTVHYNLRDVFKDHTMNHLADSELCKRFQGENDRWSKHEDAIYLVDTPAYIEPDMSLVVLDAGRYVAQSKSRAHIHLQPSRIAFLKFIWFSRKYTSLDTIIHFDGYAGKNLYHFFDDALNPLLMIMRSGLVDKNTPVLIHESIYAIPYVQYVLAMPEFKNINWVVQKKNEWIKANKIYKGMSSKAWWNDLYQLMAGQVKKHPHRKVFLNRKPQFQRRLLNNDVIEQYLVEKGFEVVYAEDLTYAQQVALFTEVKYFIAAHGAGITNLLYSDLSQVHVMELFSESLLNPHFYWFLEGAKVKYYDAVVGSRLDMNWNYNIDETLFKERVVAMLEG